MKLVGLPFGQVFDFARAVEAPVRDSAGDVQLAAIDEPRLDHSDGGSPLGLLVEPGETLGQADRCAVVAGDWAALGPATVLHEFATPGGIVLRRAYYTTDVHKMANAVLRIEGYHRLIGAVPTYLDNDGGLVRFRDREWQLAGLVGTGVDGEVIEDGQGRMIAEA